MQWRGATPCWLKTASAGIESPTVLSETEDELAERHSGIMSHLRLGRLWIANDAPAFWGFNRSLGVGGIFGLRTLSSLSIIGFKDILFKDISYKIIH